MRHLVAGFAVILLAAAMGLWVHRGVIVTVANVGDNPIENVEIRVTGRTYAVRSIEPHAEVWARVEPTNSSSVDVAWAGYDGATRICPVDCYLEPSQYTGTVSVDIADSSARVVGKDISISLMP